jgi:uncharacterized membrane protein
LNISRLAARIVYSDVQGAIPACIISGPILPHGPDRAGAHCIVLCCGFVVSYTERFMDNELLEMIMEETNTVACGVCKKPFPADQVVSGYGIRHEIEDLIRAEQPEWTDACFICRDDFRRMRQAYVTKLMGDERGTIASLEQTVLDSIHNSELLAVNANTAYREKLTFGDKIADRMAQFGGSWGFIISFFGILFAWIVINSIVLLIKPFDPYPFIFLNLVLSCLAAIQAPIIMMSQNRQAIKDRIASDNDYKVNLKAEIEVRTLHEKIDHLLLDQWSKMMNIQQLQMDMLEEMMKRMEK